MLKDFNLAKWLKRLAWVLTLIGLLALVPGLFLLFTGADLLAVFGVFSVAASFIGVAKAIYELAKRL